MPVPEEEKKSKKSNLVIFAILAFVLTIIAVIFGANVLSPDVDVEIGGKDADVADNNSNSKTIDDRLRTIQMEDNLPGVSKLVGDEEELTDAEKEQAEKVAKFKGTDKDSDESDKEKSDKSKDVAEYKKISTPSMPVVVKTAKIYIGRYSTIDQAISMQNRIIESGLNVSPFIKDLGGTYTIQIGSFVNMDGAKNIQKELVDQGFAARIVEE